MKYLRTWLVSVSAVVLCATAPAQDITTYFVEADDGALLATDVHRPAGSGPWPAILMRTPYGRVQFDGVQLCNTFVAGDAVCVIQDQRGFGDSAGESNFWQQDGADGRTTVAWISQQPWCDGNVAASGPSALGFPQYWLAIGAPEVLKCIEPTISTPDLYHHWAFPGGVLQEALMVVSEQALGTEFVDELKQHRLRDEWWDEMQQAITQPHLVNVPGLHIGGWYDVYSQGTLDAFSAFQFRGGDGARTRQVLIMGPWGHGLGGISAGILRYPANADLDIEQIERAWHDHWLKGEDTGVDAWPAATVYLMGAGWSILGIPEEPRAAGNTWVTLDAWPPPSRPLELHLGEDGRLSSQVPPTGQLELRMVPWDPVPTLDTGAGGPRDLRPIESRDDVLVFTTEVLTHPVTVMGRVFCDLWVRPDTTDLDLAVRLSDVYPSGHSVLVIDGIQRARMRCGDDRECFLEPGQPTEITVDLWSTALVFNRGHRIRISVSGTNSPRFEVNPNHGRDLDGDEPGIVARPDVLFGGDHPSHLTLPIWTQAPRRPTRRVAPTP